MKRKLKCALAASVAAVALSVGVMSGCMPGATGITSIEKTSSVGAVDYYTITLSDGTTSQFTVTNGKDGESAPSVSVKEVYDEYRSVYGDDMTFEQFCDKFVSSEDKNISSLNSLLRSTLKVYTVFSERKSTGWGSASRLYPALYGGSGVIYKMEEDYTYLVTNYHVIYDANAYGNDKISSEISAYLYGSESSPVLNSTETAYDYDGYAIKCDYVGGSITYDVAVIRAKTEDVRKINPQAIPVTVNSEFSVGDNTYAVGNPDDGGMSVTEGIVSVDSEYIVLKIDGTMREYRSIRTDTAITHGSSGGGLFNMNGELIGLNNAGDSDITSMNYAIPATVLTAVADGLIHYSALDGSKLTKKGYMGVTVTVHNSRYVYDDVSGRGDIVEQVKLKTVNASSMAEAMGLQADDEITAMWLNGVKTDVTREFHMTDVLLNVRVGDKLKVGYVRGGAAAETEEFTVRAGDMASVD